jgi:hypothetical protein
MMSRSSAFLVAATLLSVPCLTASAAESAAEKIERLHDRCRGGSGDDPKTMKACDERDRLIKSQAKQRPEVVSLYLPNNGKDGNTYDTQIVALVAYPERPCHLTEIPNYQHMRVATMSRSPVCFFKNKGKVIVVGPQIGVQEYPEVLFAVATINPDGRSATVVHPGFDSDIAQKQYIENEREKIRRSMPGASLPPRDSTR